MKLKLFNSSYYHHALSTTLVALAILAITSCSKQSGEDPLKTELVEKIDTVQRRFFDRGEIEDTLNFKLLEAKDLSTKLTDDSYKYLRYDNYCPDQFYCVINGACYYRLTNIHPNRTISGFVRKSYTYNNQTLHEDVPFTLVKSNWQQFGCHYVSPSQPIKFTIFAKFVDQVANPLLSKNKSAVEEICSCGIYAEGSFICDSNILYRCISDPYSNTCYWYNWGTSCTAAFF